MYYLMIHDAFIHIYVGNVPNAVLQKSFNEIKLCEVATQKMCLVSAAQATDQRESEILSVFLVFDLQAFCI